MNWINEQIQWFKQFFSDPDGQASSKRLMSFITVLAVLFPYLKVSINTQVIQDIPPTSAMLITAILGLGIVANKIENGKKE